MLFRSGTSTGYGPIVDIYLPTTGNDGNPLLGESNDGISVASTIATVLGVEVTVEANTFPASGTLDHPYYVNSSFVPFPVDGNPGDTLVTIRLPFGSFIPDEIVSGTIDLQVSGDADLNVPLSIYTMGGFEYGETPLDDPCCDPAVLEHGSDVFTWLNATEITPTAFLFGKAVPGVVNTGPNFDTHKFTITTQLSLGTFENIEIIDQLGGDIVYLSTNIAAQIGRAHV